MIGLSRLQQAIADVPKGGMQTGSSKVVLKLADAERIKAELEGVISERNALAAQVDSAKRLYVRLADTVDFAFNGEGWYVASGQLMVDFDKWYEATPAQCLREVQAEAGWIGFVKGYESFKLDDSPNDKLILADKYYEDVLNGIGE